MENFKNLSSIVGVDCVGWRYDPILITEIYTLERHIADFEQMAKNLSGYTKTCVISFIDLYQKVRRNFPEARAVNKREHIELGKNDIGAYDTCGHLCRYCYANANAEQVRQNMKLHNLKSPFLVGESHPEDTEHQAKQESWIDRQMRFEFVGITSSVEDRIGRRKK